MTRKRDDGHLYQFFKGCKELRFRVQKEVEGEQVEVEEASTEIAVFDSDLQLPWNLVDIFRLLFTSRRPLPYFTSKAMIIDVNGPKNMFASQNSVLREN